MQIDIMLSVVMLGVVVLIDIILSVTLLSDVTLSFFMLSVSWVSLCWVILCWMSSAFHCAVCQLSVVMLNVVMLSVSIVVPSSFIKLQHCRFYWIGPCISKWTGNKNFYSENQFRFGHSRNECPGKFCKSFFVGNLLCRNNMILIVKFKSYNGTAHFKKCLNTNIYSYLETSGGQSSISFVNVVHFFNTSVN